MSSTPPIVAFRSSTHQTPAVGALARSLQRWALNSVETLCALLLVVELAVLGLAVAARYVFDAPIVWADEFCAIVLLWLASFAFVLALARGSHMRLTYFVERAPPGLVAVLVRSNSLVSLMFFIGATVGCLDYALHEAGVLSPGLEVSMLYKVAALPIAFGAMAFMQTLAIRQDFGMRSALLSLALCAGVALLGWATHSRIAQLDPLVLSVAFAALTFGLVFVGLPIGVAFGAVALAYITWCTRAPLSIVGSRFDEGASASMLLSVPLFIFLGHLIEMTGIAKALVDLLAMTVGRVRGGLSYSMLGAMCLVSGISGSKAADMAAVAPALFPEMKKHGADEAELVSLLSASAAMSETIAPSLVLIAIGSVCGVSIAALFAGGLLPALVGLVALALVVYFRERAKPSASVATVQGTPCAPRRTLAAVFLFALPALALPALIRVSVAEGVATATEVSTIGVFYSVLVGVMFYRRFEWRRLKSMLVDTAVLTGAILFIIGAATVMSWALAQSGISARVVTFMTQLPGGATGFLLVSALMFVLLGSLLEGLPAIVLFGPMLFPVARALGIHDVHYAMVVVMAMGLGLFMPPIGIGFYAACAIGGVDPSKVMRKAWMPLLALFAALIVVAAIPQISLVAVK